MNKNDRVILSNFMLFVMGGIIAIINLQRYDGSGSLNDLSALHNLKERRKGLKKDLSDWTQTGEIKGQ